MYASDVGQAVGSLRTLLFLPPTGKYDKYGRRIDKKNDQLNRFYQLEEEEEEADDNEEDAEPAKQTKASKKKAENKSKKPKGSDDDDDEDDASSTTSSNGDKDEDAAATVDKNDEKLSRLEYLNRMARGELGSGSSSSDDSDSDDSDAEADAADDEGEKEEDIPLGEVTNRFAVLNCDWTRIRAIDLFALCQSFAPATGAVQNVTIYPSDYGLQKMKEEEQFGPQGLWKDEDDKKKKEEERSGEEEDEKMESGDDDNGGDDAPQADKSAGNSESDEEDEKEDGDDDDDDEDGADGYDSDDPLGVKKSVTLEDEMDGFDREKLRKYELQKLKYYYAVVTCDSVKTASAIFDNCDQLEYETSSNVLDLRFVPDDVEFANPPKDSCDSVPDNYKPAMFATTALQQTDVKLTWEEDDQSRMELLTRHTEWKDADDDDFTAYLASDVSSAEEEEEDSDSKGEEQEGENDKPVGKKKGKKLKKLKNRYRKMLLGSDAEDDDDEDDAGGDKTSVFPGSSDDEADGSSSSDDGGDGGEGEMEMTFTPGASDVLRAKKQRELEATETPFERYTREKKLQKNQKQHEKRARQKQLAREQKEVLRKSKNSVPNEVKLLREAIDGDSDDSDGGELGDRNFDMKKIVKKEKVQKLKGKRKAKEMKKLQAKKSGLQEGFAFDAVDPRFSALYAKGSQFQLDPTDPKFKKTEATQAIFVERRKRSERGEEVAASSGGADKQAAASATGGSGKSELKSMVENLKRKSQQDAEKKKHKAKKQRF